MAISLEVNGKVRTVDVDGETPLLWVLRDVLGMNGTKFGCGSGFCGACTVQIDGVAARACLTAVSSVKSSKVTTIEGIGADPVGAKVMASWIDLDVVQCGYCQPGQIVAATALLKTTPAPTDDQIDEAMNGNVCRCGTYPRIRAAIHKAAQS